MEFATLTNDHFFTTYSVKDLPSWLYSIDGNLANSHVIDWAKELEIKGLIKFPPNGYEFFLTKAGYEAVSRSRLQKITIWLNKNPGVIALLALLVSLGSFIVAIVALNTSS
ncbi:hypothetical protein [Chromobacterium violaceum]|nr:hypothetical protein [Chromobacterium violaceum]